MVKARSFRSVYQIGFVSFTYFEPFLVRRFVVMDDSFYPANLVEEFELVDAEYTFSNECQSDTAISSEDENAESEISDCEDELQPNFSLREEDKAEEREIDNFMLNGCNCSLGSGGSACSKYFTREEISATRISCLEMSTMELDMLVLAHLDAHRSNVAHATTSKDSSHSAGTKAGTKRRSNIEYYFRGKRVCKSTYVFAHAVGPKRFKNMVAHFDKKGLISRIHGNTK